MAILLYIGGGIICAIILIFLIGLLLPKERVVTRSTVFDTTPETLYLIVTNNSDWKYRSGLKELNILERNGENEVWEEISENGNVISFRTKEKIPYSFYSFDMSSKLFDGYWCARFEERENGKTCFTATEHIRIKNLFIRTLSYPFFNIGKLMETYQQDIKKKLPGYPN